MSCREMTIDVEVHLSYSYGVECSFGEKDRALRPEDSPC